MKRKTFIIAGVVLVAALLVGFWISHHDPYLAQAIGREAELSEMFGGDEGLETVTHSTKVEAYRLKLDPGNIANRSDEEVSAGSKYHTRRSDWVFDAPDPRDYDVTAGPILVPVGLATKVATALAAPRSYAWNLRKACIPRYGIRLAFHRGEDQVDVFLCYECMLMVVIRNGSVTGGGNFDPMDSVIYTVAKASFPDDPDLKKLRN